MRDLLNLTLSIILCCSCSVFEDRSSCPCLLELDFSQYSGEEHELKLCVTNKYGLIFRDLTIGDSCCTYVIEVPRSFVKLSVLDGVRSQRRHNDVLVIPEGVQCDSLWLHNSVVDCRGERTVEHVHFKKEYALVHLQVEGLDSEDIYPNGLLLKSNVDGIMLSDGVPSPGNHGMWLKEGDEHLFKFRVPRQIDDSMCIDMYVEGHFVESWPVGKYIIESGYDWTDENLEDIFIGVDCSGINTFVEVMNWQNGGCYDAVL